MHKLYDRLTTNEVYPYGLLCPRRQDKRLLISHPNVIKIKPKFNLFVLGLLSSALQVFTSIIFFAVSGLQANTREGEK